MISGILGLLGLDRKPAPRHGPARVFAVINGCWVGILIWQGNVVLLQLSFPSRIVEEDEKKSVYLRLLLNNSKLSRKEGGLETFRAELKCHFHSVSFEALGKIILNLQTLIFLHL